MNPEEVKNIINYLIETGEFLATQSFQIAYKKAIFYGVMDLLFTLLLIVFVVWAIKNLNTLVWAIKLDTMGNYERRDIEKDIPEKALKFYDKYLDLSLWIASIVLLGTVIAIPLIILNISAGLDWLINPELGALNILMNLIK